MKSFGFGRAMSLALIAVLGGFSAVMAANEYHLIAKYKFGAAEGSTREYFDYIMVDSAARRRKIAWPSGCFKLRPSER